MGRYDETVCHCALNAIFGYEPRVAMALIEALGSASAIFEMSRSGLDDILGPFRKHKDEICFSALEKAADELNRLYAKGCRFLPQSDAAFPPLLKDCEDPPLGLYYRSISEPKDIFLAEHNIAVVGTRDISSYGAEWCERIVEGMARSGANPTVVSGLAIGTDIVAHKAALQNGIPTIAVMATGIDDIYPFRHTHDAEMMANTPGCALVTDYPPNTAPLQVNFLRRNRIIAGMSRAVLLIESKIRGGGMMTANLAFSYGREVYALPGRIDDVRSQGCNYLIRNRVAETISSEVELGKSLGLDIQRKPVGKTIPQFMEGMYKGRVPDEMVGALIRIVETIRKHRDIDVEDVAGKCGLQYSTARELMSRLEADGIISINLLQRCALVGKIS